MRMNRATLVAAFIFFATGLPITASASEGGNDSSAQIKNPDGTVVTVKKRADGKIVKIIRQGNKVRVVVEEPWENPLLKLFKRKD